MIAMAALADVVTVYDPTRNNFGAMLEPPSADYWLGTNQFGRDLYSRIVYGARTALLVGFVSASVGATIGLILGAASAYFGGWFDLLFQRVMDVVMAFPLVILALAVVSIFGTGVMNVILAITIPLTALRARGALERARRPRDALHRRGASLRLQRYPHRAAPHGAQRDGPLPHHDHRLCRPGDPDRGVAVIPGARRAGAGAGLGADAPWRRPGVRRERAVGGRSPGIAISLAVFGFSLFGDLLRDWLDPEDEAVTYVGSDPAGLTRPRLPLRRCRFGRRERMGLRQGGGTAATLGGTDPSRSSQR